MFATRDAAIVDDDVVRLLMSWLKSAENVLVRAMIREQDMREIPLVSVAFPLYRSAPFVDNIAANIDTFTWPRLEILISDRHSDDDALDRLADRYRDDARVRVLRYSDRADWVTHYNDLLRAAQGRYFAWIPHDDVYQAGYLEALVAALEGRDDAILAYGVTELEDAGYPVPMQPFRPAPVQPGERWTARVALRLLVFWDLFFAVHGVFRRDDVVARQLWLPRMRETVFADICWVFSVALAGRLVFAPSARCRKRYFAASASADWRFGVRQAVEECSTMCGSLWRSGYPAREKAVGIVILAYLAGLRVVWRAIRPFVGRAGQRAPRPTWRFGTRALWWLVRDPSRPSLSA